ncbi:hypothetical protein LLEC1_06820 [Akanthomyces lecanii]|uniref:Uncharacterized protein n=1 Tax=Cordyceps confragosa TaxID=2714763 RepID=A0A179IMR2_CORDF|nr:hypothetical protein LLEC1_06820 [Akanthomyces lecanii]
MTGYYTTSYPNVNRTIGIDFPYFNSFILMNCLEIWANMRIFLLPVALASWTVATPVSCNATVDNWLYTGEMNDKTLALLHRPDIAGVQALYNWKSLEPRKDEYDFSRIVDDLNIVQAKGKQFWVQLQDRTFSIEYNPVPKYLHAPIVPVCGGEDCEDNCQAGGWLTVHWNEHVRARFQALLKAMAGELDGRIYGINMAEMSVEPETGKNNFTCQGYFDGELENADYAASVFHKSYVVQYVIFWPCGWANANNYLSKSFNYYSQHGVGVGGPDLIPYRKGQEGNSYPFLSEYHSRVPISVIAVQEPDLAAINPNPSKPFTKQEFTDFAINKLGSQLIFWGESSPWLSW